MWKVSIAYTLKLYPILNGLDPSEKYGLASQMKRASVSICSNIAEGTSRKTTNDISRFFDIALGSSYELETQLILVKELSLMKSDMALEFIKELNYIQAMINKYKRKVIENSVK
jgi:four helix bundle protein